MKYVIKDFTVEDICKRWNDEQLKVDHEYQRAPRWTVRQKQLLVDSVLRGYALPSFFLHRRERSFGDQVIEEWFIVDGQQRIRSLAEFKGGSFELLDPAKNGRWFPKFISDSEVPCEWADCEYKHLETSQRDNFDRTKLRVALIDASEDEVRDLFVRLQAGSPLRPQDKRDAFPGGMPDFIKRLGGRIDTDEDQEVKLRGGHRFFEHFLKWSTPAKTHSARELAAKIVMQLDRDQHRSSLSATNSLALDEFYHQSVNFREHSDNARRYTAIFDDVLDILSEYNGIPLTPIEWVHLFVLWQRLTRDYTDAWKKQMKSTLRRFKADLAKAQADPTSHATDPLWTRFGMLRAGRGSDSAAKFALRQEFFDEWFISKLKAVALDAHRSFDPQTRDLLLEAQSGVCGYHDRDFCDNSTLRPENAEVHHILPHSLGGKTEPSNAVLTHASCNRHIGPSHEPVTSQLVLNTLKSFAEPN